MEESIKEKQSNYVTHFYNDRVFEEVCGLPSMSNNSIEVSKGLIALCIKYQKFENKNTDKDFQAALKELKDLLN